MFWQDSGDAFQQTLLSNEGKSLHMSWAKDRQQRWTVHFCWGQQYISCKQKCQFNQFVSKVIRCLVGMLLWTGSLLLCGRQPWEVAKSAGPLFQNCGNKPTYLPQRLTNPNPSWKKQPLAAPSYENVRTQFICRFVFEKKDIVPRVLSPQLPGAGEE